MNVWQAHAHTERFPARLADESLTPVTESHSWQMKGSSSSAYSKTHKWDSAHMKVQIPEQVLFWQEEIGCNENI